MYDYALVHLTYTVPVAAVLTVVVFPFLTKFDVYKILFLITVAVTYTIPWDSYLIQTSIWTYPPDVILGPTLFGIPIEEVFFFAIQTYTTTILHILINKPTLLSTYLQDDSDPAVEGVSWLQTKKRFGQLFFFFSFVTPLSGLLTGEARKSSTYINLICAWASPVLLLLWSLSYQLLIQLPRTHVSLPITVSTLYLWVVDTIALRRGTWSISSGTKLGYEVWPGLDTEEAVFFLATNTLVVFGSVAFDNAVTILDTFPDLFPERKTGSLPTPQLLVKALLMPSSSYSSDRLTGLRNALTILSKKSRSFYLASGVFNGLLRIDLILLYAFCRVADDLVDNSTTPAESERWIRNLSNFLKTKYSPKSTPAQIEKSLEPFVPEARSVLNLLPTQHLPPEPLYSLVDGFRTDGLFLAAVTTNPSQPAPIQSTSDLETYASRVASTVAELCLSLVYAHDPQPDSSSSASQRRTRCLAAGKRMGLVLQYINITRDVSVDAAQDRCYIPADWFNDAPAQTPAQLKAALRSYRARILKMAMDLYHENVDTIEDLPEYARGGIRVAVESYVEIGRELERRLKRGREWDVGPKGKATVPRWRRMGVGWWTLAGFTVAARRAGGGKRKVV